MRTILVGSCSKEHVFGLSDPDALSEAEFEVFVVKAFGCVYQSYHCVDFRGTFRYDNRLYQADLALVARDMSHWFVIEVELLSHSFDAHVLPQVRAFRYGTPEADCVPLLAHGLGVAAAQAATLVEWVPRGVAVIANRRDKDWEVALRAHDIQLLTVAAFRSPANVEAFEIDGALEVVQKSVGFGQYSAIDRSLKFAKGVRLPAGDIQLNDPFGSVSTWHVIALEDAVWVTKERGALSIDDGAFVQIVRTIDGRLSFRLPQRARVG